MAELSVAHACTCACGRRCGAAWGELAERELLQVRVDFGDGDFGEGEAAPLEGYDGVSLAAVWSALDAYGAVLARASAALDPRRAARRLRRRAPAAARAGRGRPRAVGPGGPPDRLPGRAADRRRGGRARCAVNADAARGRPRGRRRGRGGGRRGGLPLREDEGRHRRRRRPRGRRARRGRRRDGDPGRRQRRLARRSTRRSPTCARWRPAGIELCEEPIHGIEAMRAVRAKSPVPVAMDETAAERGAPGLRRRRRRVPEDRPLRRDLRAAARRPRGPGGGHEGLRGVELRRAARHRRRPARGRRAARLGPGGLLRAGDARRVRGASRACSRRSTASSPCPRARALLG